MKRTFLLFAVAGALAAADNPATDALDAIRAINSSLDAGVNFPAYGKLVVDAKIKLDKYASRPDADAALRGKMDDVMRLYQFAGKRWNLEITGDALGFVSLGEAEMNDAAVKACPEAVKIIDTYKDKPRPATFVATRVGQPMLWRCAADKLGAIVVR